MLSTRSFVARIRRSRRRSPASRWRSWRRTRPSSLEPTTSSTTGKELNLSPEIWDQVRDNSFQRWSPHSNKSDYYSRIKSFIQFQEEPGCISPLSPCNSYLIFLLPFLTKFFNPIDDALQKLAIFEGKYVRLKDERDNVAKAKEALELQDVSVNLVSAYKTLLLILKTVKLNYLQSRVSLF